jgi:hypothetical protein
MKKIILLALTALVMVGCTKKDSNGHIAINTGNDYSNPQISLIDSINMKKEYIEAALLPIAIGLISYGVHNTEAICCLMGGICTGAYVFIQNKK